MSERSTFSPFWHRVRTMKPRLRPHVQIVRQHYRGQRWYVVQDPTSNAYFRLSPTAHEFVGLFDGQRTVEEIWRLGLTRHGDDALTQNDVINVLGQLHSGNLLRADTSPEAEQLLSRGRERIKKKAVQQAIGLMYFRVRLFNPDWLLTKLEPIFRPVLSKAGFVAWCALVVAAIASILPHWRSLVGGFDSAVAPENWAWLAGGYVLLKLWHELGHGLICKRHGGQVPEFGAMMLVLVPSPYVDASSAWAFKSKWARIAVGGGGMMFELAAASVAAFVWVATRESPGLVHQLAYNAMLTSSISTVLFNANPLMRFDGYYMLSDAIEVPNLMQRSTNMLKFLIQKHAFGLDNAQSPTSSPGEALVLLLYGVLALIYRVFIFFSITLYIMGKLFAIGLILAVWTAAMWFVLPVGSCLNWLATNPGVQDRRERVWGVTAGALVLAVLLVGVVRWPDHRRADGVVESEQMSGVFARTDGFLDTIHARTGTRVKQGDPIVTLVSPEAEARLRIARAELNEARVREYDATNRNPASAQVAREYVRAYEEQLAYLEDQVSKLVVRAPRDGVVVGRDLSQRVGVLVREGDALCDVVDERDLRVVAVLSQDQADWISTLEPDRFKVEMRRASRVHEIIPATMTRAPSAARRELPHAALGYQGGGTVETRHGEVEQGAQRARRPLFRASFAALPSEEGASATVGVPGERVRLRFTLPSRPLLAQWIDRVERAVQGRARV